MPGPKVYALWWGDRGVMPQKGIIQYSASSLSLFLRRAHRSPQLLPLHLLLLLLLPRRGVETKRHTRAGETGVSPFRQRATHNLFRSYLFNGFTRLSAHVGYWIVPVALGYGTYTWAKKYDTWLNSKAAHVAGHGAH
ncbi:ubiquinol--cytochrome-c reductase subunit 8 [Steccherinum ochraceum]|uniref:Cytochrome b-c1 complex subunit 8 n=1 Tax=Steccherinum ochraceum TaxID=92696 RepID=A0A4R0RAW2_9APHY|nr:ubiquinol--cytochrome-c reductase subunit 8 [Steccherinum ochraceum]